MKTTQIIAMILISLVWAATASALDVQLKWDPNSEVNLAGYKVYYGVDGFAAPSVQDVSNQTVATISGLDPAKNYSFAVTAYNTSSIESSYSNIITVLESIPPSISITNPGDNAKISDTVLVSASATDNTGVVKVEFLVNGNIQSTVATAPYEFTWDTRALQPGTYSITAKAYDAAGNVGTTSISAIVASELTPPTVSCSVPVTGSASGTVMVSCSATDDVAVARVEIYVNSVMAAAFNTIPYQYAWDTISVANGQYTISARAYDTAGNIGVSADSIVNVFNDTSAPTVSIILPANSGTISGTVSISASATDNVGVSKVEIYLDGILRSTSSGEVYGYQLDTLTIANGTHSISARAYDAAGNVGVSAESIVNVFNDTSAPTVSIVLPANSGTISGTVSISASATDNVGVSKVEFYLDGILKATSSGGLYGYQLDTLTIAEGIPSISAKAYDAAGNIGLSG
ncbi:MAG: fibronectin type III domain-containing protein, partial [Deltaproteobacteria bacterium]|nr:fibronectin type III domain-containing protein [Deltaproteobacteria bacterium]